MPNASANVRAVFESSETPLTMHELLPLLPELRKNEVSMALCYLMKCGYLSRIKVDRRGTRGRKEIWEYTFHADRQKGESHEQNEN